MHLHRCIWLSGHICYDIWSVLWKLIPHSTGPRLAAPGFEWTKKNTGLFTETVVCLSYTKYMLSMQPLGWGTAEQQHRGLVKANAQTVFTLKRAQGGNTSNTLKFNRHCWRGPQTATTIEEQRTTTNGRTSTALCCEARQYHRTTAEQYNARLGGGGE